MNTTTKNILMKSGGLVVAGGIFASLYGAGKLFFTEEKSNSSKIAVIGALAILVGVELFNYSIAKK